MTTVDTKQRTGETDWHLTFGRLLRSEWIKLRTLRSTMWCGILIAIFIIGITALISGAITARGVSSADEQRSLAVTIITGGVLLAQLIAAVIGVLVISGEYGTGMIRSTFAASPRRVRIIVAKALVLAATTFVLSLVSLAIAAAIATVLLDGKGVDTRLLDPLVLRPVLGTAVYLALIAVFAFAIGALVRNSAAGISIALGTLVVLPTVLAIFAALTQATWITDVANFLPGAAGGRIYAYVGTATQSLSDTLVLTPWQGLLVLLGWIVVVGGLALLLIKRRDA